MKKQMKKPMKNLIKTAFFIAICGIGLAKAEERDPFKPYTWSAPASVSDAKTAVNDGEVSTPLIDKPLTAYTVIGVVISPTDALAVLKSRDKHEYFAYIGDQVGSEGGKLETINTDGVTVNISGKIIPLKVSNRFETQDEKPNEKTGNEKK